MIDWERMRELRHDIGAENFEEVVEMFFEEADAAVAHLTTCEDAPALSAELHALKGAALNLGFDRLAELCRQGESHAAEGDMGVDLDALRLAYAEVRRVYRHSTAASFAA